MQCIQCRCEQMLHGVVAVSVCLCVSHDCEPCKNGGTDRDGCRLQRRLMSAQQTTHFSFAVHIGATWRIRLNDHKTAAMRAVVAIIVAFSRNFSCMYDTLVSASLRRRHHVHRCASARCSSTSVTCITSATRGQVRLTHL